MSKLFNSVPTYVGFKYYKIKNNFNMNTFKKNVFNKASGKWQQSCSVVCSSIDYSSSSFRQQYKITNEMAY